MVLFPLVLDIPLDTCLIEADGGDKVSDAPYAAVEIDVPDEFEAFLDSDARFDLEGLHDGSNGEVRGYFNLEVDMVFIGVERVYVERRILFHYCIAG